MKNFPLFLLTSAIFLVILCAGGRQAEAYCVYNETDYSLEVRGEDCHRCYSATLGPMSHGCCPGNKSGCRGKTWIRVGDRSWGSLMYLGKQVTAHGWVKVYGGKRIGNLDPRLDPDSFSGEVYNDEGQRIWWGRLHYNRY